MDVIISFHLKIIEIDDLKPSEQTVHCDNLSTLTMYFSFAGNIKVGNIRNWGSASLVKNTIYTFTPDNKYLPKGYFPKDIFVIINDAAGMFGTFQLTNNNPIKFQVSANTSYVNVTICYY